MTKQQRAALALANEKRKKAALFKNKLRRMSMGEGLHVVADLVEHPEPTLNHLRLLQVISAVRYCGPWHADQIAKAGGVNRDARLRDISPGRRQRLAAVILSEAERYEDYKAKKPVNTGPKP